MSSLVPVNGHTPPVQWDRELEGAKMLMRSGLLPDSIKTAEAALFVILTGRDLGLSPVQSLRSINLIKGKVEVAADMQLGLFHRAGGKSQWVTLTNEEAVLRLDAPWLLEPHEETFSMEDAKRAGLTGSQNYKAYPRAMLRSRAITASLKSIGFDPTAGVYAPGELGGDAVVVGEEVAIPVTVDRGEDAMEAAASDDAAEAEQQALRAIEERLPMLTIDQQIYVKEKLGSGSDPVALWDLIEAKMPAKAKAS